MDADDHALFRAMGFFAKIWVWWKRPSSEAEESMRALTTEEMGNK